MRFFEARPLLHEIGCALGKAHNVFHLKGVLRRPLETTGHLRMFRIVSDRNVPTIAIRLQIQGCFLIFRDQSKRTHIARAVDFVSISKQAAVDGALVFCRTAAPHPPPLNRTGHSRPIPTPPFSEPIPNNRDQRQPKDTQG